MHSTLSTVQGLLALLRCVASVGAQTNNWSDHDKARFYGEVSFAHGHSGETITLKGSHKCMFGANRSNGQWSCTKGGSGDEYGETYNCRCNSNGRGTIQFDIGCEEDPESLKYITGFYDDSFSYLTLNQPSHPHKPSTHVTSFGSFRTTGIMEGKLLDSDDYWFMNFDGDHTLHDSASTTDSCSDVHCSSRPENTMTVVFLAHSPNDPKGHVAACSASHRCNKAPIDGLDTDLFAVRCCSNGTPTGGTTEWTYKSSSDCRIYGASDANGSGCLHGATYQEALDHCEVMGGRLCTAEELKNECVRGTGCDYDEDFVWSSTPWYW